MQLSRICGRAAAKYVAGGFVAKGPRAVRCGGVASFRRSSQWVANGPQEGAEPASYDSSPPPDAAGEPAPPRPTAESVKALFEDLQGGKRVRYVDAVNIVLRATAIFRPEPSVSDLSGRVVIVGDLHGSLGDLLYILNTHGLPDGKADSITYVFNGDLVDRGHNSCEVLLLVLALKCVWPDNVCVNRGNHETEAMNMRYGFYVECMAKYNHRFFLLCTDLFAWLPLACVVNNSAVVLHGGLPTEATLADIRRLPRGPQANRDAAREEVMWNDPAEIAGERDTNSRGIGRVFGERLTRRWLAAEGLRYVIRSHQCKSPEGVSVNHSGLVFTVFSASNYYGTLWPSMRSRAFANNGSVLLMDSADPNPTPVSFSWDPILASFDDPETAPFLPLSGSGRGLPYEEAIDFASTRKYLFPLAVYEHLSEIEALVMHIKQSPEGAEHSDDDILQFASRGVTGVYMSSKDLSKAISRRDPPWSSWHADIREQFPHDDPSTTTPQALFQHLRAHLTLAQASDAHIHYYISKCYPPSHKPQAPSGLQEPSPEQLARFRNTSRARPLEWHAD